MFKFTFIAFALAVLGSPLAASAADSMTTMMKTVPQGALRVSASLKPLPARQGRAVITITVKDPAGKPIKAATVKLASSMPMMSMTGPSVTARESGPGVYTAKINLNFATMWRFDVTASGGGKTGSAHVSADVK
jgi:nitrogen fixation protein FixH